MAGRIPPEFIDQLLTRIDIVEVIDSRVPLRRAGRNYQACCPFHTEKTPSFSVSQDKQFYHCFGCGAHGTAIGFLMDYEHLSFPEAVAELAQQAGLEVPRIGGEVPRQEGAPLWAILEAADGYFRRQLRQHPQAPRAVAYLKGRGLSGEIAAEFGLGYAPPGWDGLHQALGQTPADRALLIQAGLAVEQSGSQYDRFRDRVMFPIRDRRGRTLGFGGRVLGDDKPKYLNSPETPLFHKGRELYGLYEARKALRHIDRLLVVEGYLDVIALAQHGIRHAVATLGTATTPEHVQRLFRATRELVFCFDGDPAGREAAWKALVTALPQVEVGREVRFLFLPEGEDPDTLVRKEGASAFEQRLRAATPLSDYLFERLAGEVDMDSLAGQAQFAKQGAELVAQLPAGVFREMMHARLGERVKLTSRQLDIPPAPRPKSPPRGNTAPPPRMTPVRLAIAILVQYPQMASATRQIPVDWRRLDVPGIGLLMELLDLTLAQPNLKAASLLERWRDRPQHPYLERLAGYDFRVTEEGLTEELLGALACLNRQAWEQEAAHLIGKGPPSQMTAEERTRLMHLLRQGQTLESQGHIMEP